MGSHCCRNAPSAPRGGGVQAAAGARRGGAKRSAWRPSSTAATVVANDSRLRSANCQLSPCAIKKGDVAAYSVQSLQRPRRTQAVASPSSTLGGLRRAARNRDFFARPWVPREVRAAVSSFWLILRDSRPPFRERQQPPRAEQAPSGHCVSSG